MSRGARFLGRAMCAVALVLPCAVRADLVEGALAPAGECARAPELPAAVSERGLISTLFAPVDVAAGGTMESAPGRPAARIFEGPGPCDEPGSGCAGPGSRPVPDGTGGSPGNPP